MMRVTILHNRDHELLVDDPGREAREDVVKVAAALHEALSSSFSGEEHEVCCLGVGRNLFEVGTALERDKPDLVINLCESLAADSRGEMALPCLLDLLGLPYTGSSGLSLGLALHKHKAKEILVARGISTPAFEVATSVADARRIALPFPLIVKPAREDASVGIDFSSVVNDGPSLAKAVSYVLTTFRQPAIVEEYIDGREIYVPLLGNRERRPLPLSEIRFGKSFEDRPRIVSYRAKWDLSSPECIDSPAEPCALPSPLEERLVAAASAAFEALECRDYGRVDVRLAPDGTPYVIDVNPNCDLHPEAGFARAAASAGISYPELARLLVELALERHHGNPSGRTAGHPGTRRVAGQGRNLHAARSGVRPRADRPRAQAE